MDFSITREQARELDGAAIERYGVPGLILMENAGRACADEAEAMLCGAEGKNVSVFCGPGNNGGDGFVVARHLANRGARVRSLLLGGTDEVLRRGTDASTNLGIALKMGIPPEELKTEAEVAAAAEGSAAADLIVDALLGTGLRGAVEPPFTWAIDALNLLGRPILAIDVPSGLDCNAGTPLGTAIRAARTVTFVLSKRGFARQEARAFTGELKVAEISVPRSLIESMVECWRLQGG